MANFNVPNRTLATYALNNFTTDTCESTNPLGTGVPMSPWTNYLYTPVITYPLILPITAFGAANFAGVNLVTSLLTTVTGLPVPVFALDCLRVLVVNYTTASTVATTLTMTGFDDRYVPVTAVMPIASIVSTNLILTATTSFKYLTSVVIKDTITAGSISVGISNAVFGSPYYIVSKITGVNSIQAGAPSIGVAYSGFNFYTGAPTSACTSFSNALAPASIGDARGVFTAAPIPANPATTALVPLNASLDCFRVSYYNQGADAFIQAQLNANPIGLASTGEPIYPVTRNQYQSQIMRKPAPAINAAWTGLNIYQADPGSYFGGVTTLSPFDIYGVQYPGDATDYNKLNPVVSMQVPNA